MRVVIAGGREYKPDQQAESSIVAILQDMGCTTIISGGASGADAFGEQIARKYGFSLHKVPADWKKHGKSAGPIRNAQMADSCDALMLFPGGKGTRNMHMLAQERYLPVYTYAGGGYWGTTKLILKLAHSRRRMTADTGDKT
jgi:hypothetical protein